MKRFIRWLIKIEEGYLRERYGGIRSASFNYLDVGGGFSGCGDVFYIDG